MPHETGKFEAGKKSNPEKNNGKIDSAKKKADANLKAHSEASAADLIKQTSEEKKGKDMAEAVIARMAKKPGDLKDYKIHLPYKNHIENSEFWKNELPADSDKRSPENTKLNNLLVGVETLALKKENELLINGFIARKGEKRIDISWPSGEDASSVEIKYGDEMVDDLGEYNDGKSSQYVDDGNLSAVQRKQVYAKAIGLLSKVAEILRKGFKLPEPKYMVVKTTAQNKKDISVSLKYPDDNKNGYNEESIPLNTLVKVVYTSPETGNCYVIAKRNDGSNKKIEGFIDGKLLEPYDAGKFHPEISPVKKAVVKRNKETEENGGLNLRNDKNGIIGKVPLGVEMTVLALESMKGKYGNSIIRALVQFKSKNKVITGFVAASFLDVR